MDSIVVKLLTAAIALVAVVLIVIFVTHCTLENIMLGTDQAAEAEEEEVRAEEGIRDPLPTVSLDEFILTKRDPRSGRMHTYQIVLHLALSPEGENALRNEIESRRAQVRDTIFSVLGEKQIEELDYANKPALKDDLIHELNQILAVRPRIQDVYFTEFVIQ